MDRAPAIIPPPSPFAQPRRLAKAAAEMVEIAEGDINLAALPAMPYLHFRPEFKAELVLKGSRVGVDGRGPSRPRRLAGILTEAFDVSDRQALRHDAVGDRIRVGHSEQ